MGYHVFLQIARKPKRLITQITSAHFILHHVKFHVGLDISSGAIRSFAYVTLKRTRHLEIVLLSHMFRIRLHIILTEVAKPFLMDLHVLVQLLVFGEFANTFGAFVWLWIALLKDEL